MLFPPLCICFYISQLSKELFPATNPNKPSLAFVFSHSPHDTLIDKKNSLALPPPILPLTRLHALFIGVFKSHIGLAWIVRCSNGGVINLSAENLSTPWTPTPRVLCMRAGLREWVHPVPSRQGIYLLNSQSLSVVGGQRCNGLGLGLSPSLSLSLALSVPSFSRGC